MMVDAYKEAMNGVLDQRLRDPAQRETVVSVIMEGFNRLDKKAVPDLEKRTKDMEDRVRQMSENIELSFVNGRLVVKVAGSSESLMKQLRFGSDWFEPWDKVDEVLLAAVLVDPEK
jgi:hypothetical protein